MRSVRVTSSPTSVPSPHPDTSPLPPSFMLTLVCKRGRRTQCAVSIHLVRPEVQPECVGSCKRREVSHKVWRAGAMLSSCCVCSSMLCLLLLSLSLPSLPSLPSSPLLASLSRRTSLVDEPVDCESRLARRPLHHGIPSFRHLLLSSSSLSRSSCWSLLALHALPHASYPRGSRGGRAPRRRRSKTTRCPSSVAMVPRKKMESLASFIG